MENESQNSQTNQTTDDSGTNEGAGTGTNGTTGDGGNATVTLDEQYVTKVSTLVSERFKDLGVTAEQAKELATELAKEKGTTTPSSAPETYADFKMPEGETPNKEALEKVAPLFKKWGLSQEQAQEAVDFHMEGQRAFNADKQARVEAIKNDKELGGDNFTKVNGTVARAMNSFLSESEQQDLVDHIARFGTSPGLARLLYRVGTKMGEDTKWDTGSNVQQNNDATVLANMYPSMKD